MITTYFAVNFAALVPLGALGQWLDVSVRRFVPAHADDDGSELSLDLMVRRLAGDLAGADRDPAAGADTYRAVVVALDPAIRRRLDPQSTASPEVRARLAAVRRRGGDSASVRSRTHLLQLLRDLEE